MGNHCSAEKQISNLHREKDDLSKNKILNTNEYMTISECLSFKSYKEYYFKIDLFKKKVASLIKKIQVLNDFPALKHEGRKRVSNRIITSYHKNDRLK